MSCSRNSYATVWSPSCNITNSTTQVQSYKTHCGCLKYHLMNVFENEGRGCLVRIHAWMYSKLHWEGMGWGLGRLGGAGASRRWLFREPSGCIGFWHCSLSVLQTFNTLSVFIVPSLVEVTINNLYHLPPYLHLHASVLFFRVVHDLFFL